MAKITLTDIGSGYGSTTVINANNALIETAIENTLSRNGTSPNQMQATLDMNSNRITNLPNASNNSEPVTLGQAASIQSFTGVVATAGAIGAVLWPQTSAESSAGVTPTNYEYEPGNVLRYGTNTTPGTTDMTTAIQAALDVAASHEAVIPPGIYKTTSALTPVASSKINCQGEIRHTSTNAVTISVDNVEWYGGTFTGDGATASQNAIVLSSANDCVVDVYKISACLNKGIDVNGTSDGNYVQGRQISGCTGTTGVGISLYGAAVTNTTIGPSNCNANRLGMSINGVDEYMIISPNCSNNTDAGLIVDGIVSATGDGAKNGSILGAVCNNNGTTTYGGIYLGNGTQNLRIIGPICNDNTGAGIRTSGGAGYKNAHISIVAPYCEGNGQGGINLSNTVSVQIVNPDCRFNTGKGIYLFSSDRGKIIGGNVYGNTAEGVYLQSDYCTVQGVTSLLNTHGVRIENGGSAGPNNRVLDCIVSGPSDTFTDGDVTVGSDQITLTSHDFDNRDPVQLTTTGTLPAGLSTGTTYYVDVIDADTVVLYSDNDLTSVVDITAAAGGGTHTISMANTTASILDTPGTAEVRGNSGYVTEASGTGSVTSGGTTDVITHGLSVTPSAADIHITLTENPTNTPGAIWVDTIGATNFTVNCENDPGASNLDFSWKVTS